MAGEIGKGSGGGGRNALAVVSPRGKAVLAKPCRLVALAVCLLVMTLFMLQNVYVWCEGRSEHMRGAEEGQGAKGTAAGSNASVASGQVKALLCIASQRYTGINSHFLHSLTSALASRERRDGSSVLVVSADDGEAGRWYQDGEPNVRSWKSQWLRWNLTVAEQRPKEEELPDMLEVAQVKAVNTRATLGSDTPAGCVRLSGPTLLHVEHLDSHGTLACPVLWECRKAGKVRALCWDPQFLDAYRPASLPTEGGGFVTPRPGEALVSNYQVHVGAVVLLEHVYLTPLAQVFDSSNLYLKGGCWEKQKVLFKGKAETGVVHLPLGINLCSSHADSQFHGLVELLGRMALLVPAMRALPGATLLLTHRDQPHVAVLLQMLGFPGGLDGFQVQLVRPNQVARADLLLVAQGPSCGQSSASVWRHIRREHFKVPMDGRTALERRPQDWYLVLLERKGSRGIEQYQELLDGLVGAVGEARVKVFSDRVQWSMSATQELFRDAAIMVGAHGAGLSNMVFMPQLASVLEVRPANFSNTCYHMLADSLRFNYYRFDSPGVKSSILQVDVEQVVGLVSAIVQAKGRPAQYYDELASAATSRRRRRLLLS